MRVWVALRSAAAAFLPCVLLVAGLAVPAAAGTGAGGWSQDGFGPAHRYDNPFETALTAATVRRLSYRWSTPAAGCDVDSTVPVVSHDRLFQLDADLALSAYDARSGQRLWRWVDPTFEWCYNEKVTLAVAGDILLVGWTEPSGSHSTVGGLRAFDARTGRALWESPDYIEPADAMVVDAGVVVISGISVDFEDETLGSYAFRVTDGKVLWVKVSDVGSGGWGLTSPAASRGRLLLFTLSGSVAVNIATGAALWTSPQQWWLLAASGDGRQFYTQAGDTLAAVDAATGAVLWSVPGASGSLAVDGTRLYISRAGHLVARSTVDGSILWDRNIGSKLDQPVVAGSLVYALVKGYGYQILDKATGTPVRSLHPYTPVIGHAVVVDGRLYALTPHGVQMYSP